VITRYGLEGSVIYALGPALREALAKDGGAALWLDLRPDENDVALAERIKATPAHQSLANRLRKALNLSPAALSILREAGAPPAEPLALAKRVKGVRLPVTGLQPLARAISSAGGVKRDALDARFTAQRVIGGVAHVAATLLADGSVQRVLLSAEGVQERRRAQVVRICRESYCHDTITPI
jgi:predicted flavoprotein YhiN